MVRVLERSIRPIALGLVLGSLLVLGGPLGSDAATAPSFSVTVLAPFGANAGNDYPTAINDGGIVTGEVENGSSLKGFVYEPASKSGGHSYAVPPPKGDTGASFNDMNDDGVAAGFACSNKKCTSYLPYGGIIKGSKITLTPLSSPGKAAAVSYGSAFSIDSAGAITGYEVLKSGQNDGLLWKNLGTPTTPRWSRPMILPKPKSYTSVDGVAIDSAGDVGGYGAHGPYIQATISGPSGPSVPLPGLTKTAPANVSQTDVSSMTALPANRGPTGNGSATVVGDSYVSGSNQPYYMPVLWHVNIKKGKVSSVSKPLELGSDYNQPAGGMYGEAESINAHGWIVGMAATDIPTTMLWIGNAPKHASTSYSSYQLQTLTPDGSPGCAFNSADFVNGKGQIVGAVAASASKFTALQGGLSPLRWAVGARGAISAPARSASKDCSAPSSTNQSIFLLTPS